MIMVSILIASEKKRSWEFKERESQVQGPTNLLFSDWALVEPVYTKFTKNYSGQ